MQYPHRRHPAFRSGHGGMITLSMSDTARKAVICIGLLAFSLSGIVSSFEAVICLGPNGHFAVEAPHEICRAGACHENPDNMLAAVVSDGGRTASPGACGCIDIPFSNGKTHFYSRILGKGPLDCLPAPACNNESPHAPASQNQPAAFAQTSGPTARGLDTTILLI